MGESRLWRSFHLMHEHTDVSEEVSRVECGRGGEDVKMGVALNKGDSGGN
jgi:hypothetical protein